MTENIYLPINQGEQAKQKNRNTLLARGVFQKIASLLESSLAKINAAQCGELDDLDEHRAHEAILIDGGRGTGKSSVLVNLQLYMDGEEALKNDLLILKPVDPTLLENGDDLFLNIIVAALIRDKQIKNALNKGDKKAEQFYEQLQKLGNALEGVQTQREKHGLDKLRAFIGNHGIADEVHQLFKCALELTGKKLIVLPIDDVDTSLQHAFENMEVVRKYLASPFVVPIISGDLDLYHDVTWRDFYGRIIKYHKVELNEATLRSKSLANEYQRKVLPLPRRINVPNIEDYFKNEEIVLTESSQESKHIISLPKFKSWLDALINERVNGSEKSRFELPITSVRELAQLISRTKSLIKLLEINNIHKNELSKKIVVGDILPQEIKNNENKSTINDWYIALSDYFSGHERGGGLFLVMNANQMWSKLNTNSKQKSVLEIDLFRPQNHELKIYNNFIFDNEISSRWAEHLKDLLPAGWNRSLPKHSLLPYPLPEKGVFSGKSKKPVEISDIISNVNPDLVEKSEFVRQLMCHSGFYTRSNVGNVVLTGRVFELLITSLIKNVTQDDISNLLIRAPFYSAMAFASTKTFNISDSITEEIEDYSQVKETLINNVIDKLTKDIEIWRDKHLLSSSRQPHSWLIYNVMNKYFNQVSVDKSWISNEKGYFKSNPELKYTADVAIRSFESICAVFGSFEKGEIFGMDNKIAFINGSVAEKDFEQNQLYLQNIKPFLKSVNGAPWVTDIANKSILYSFTRALYNHPLKELFDNVFSALPSIALDNSETSRIKKSALSQKDIISSLDLVVRNYLKNFFPEAQNATEVISSLARNPEHNSEIFQQFKTKMTKEESELWEKLRAFNYVENRTIVGKFFNLMMNADA